MGPREGEDVLVRQTARSGTRREPRLGPWQPNAKPPAVGERAEVEKAHKGATTQVVDLGGKTLMPSFLDAHSHYYSSLTVANQAKGQWVFPEEKLVN